MRTVVAVAQRELLSLFCSPIAYIVIAGFLLLTGVVAIAGFDALQPGKEASLRSVFSLTPFALTIIVPAISMRMLSEEYGRGTIETLMTAPVSDTQVVLGKYLASMLFYAMMLVATLCYPIALLIFGNPDMGAMLSTYLGLLLMGAFFLGVGLFASSLTTNQIVAWMSGAVPLILFAWLTRYLTSYPNVPALARQIVLQVNVVDRFDQFSRGLITTDGVVFFLVAGGLFVFLTIKVVESKRWR